ncbi:MAG: AI-2E family transporter, partial [Ignavibacteria bacterium]|nr:AI-2E family transporter [Ignavibacteria bacterium]
MKTVTEPKVNKQMTIAALIFGFAAFVFFMILTKIIYVPLILFVLSIFFLAPFRKENDYIKRLMLIISLVFIGWILSQLGFALVPFVIAFLIAYLLDPVVTFLKNKGLPRWLTSLIFIFSFVGAVALISIYIFPMIFVQLQDAINKITNLVTTMNTYLDTRKIYRLLDSIGIRNEDVQKLIKKEAIPEIKGMMTGIFNSLMSLLTGLSSIATQLLNVILIPIFAFYFLKDFTRIKTTIKAILEKKNVKFLNDLRRINDIFMIYIGWQVIAASMVATVCSTAFSFFGIAYPIVLGIICGFLNPIPYLGFIASMIISSLTIIIVGPE